jgi:uncharacterized protein
MKILAVADVKPKTSLVEQIKTELPDLVITLGDLEYSDIATLALITHIPKIGVYGNHCFPGYMEQLGIFDMHLHTWSYKGLTFGGFEGCVRYKKNPYAKMYTQEEASALMDPFPPVDVFIAHCPPFGVNDNDDPAHIGFQALRTYLKEKKPRYFLHGHTYPTKETLVTQFLDTEIMYVHGDAIVELL